MAGVKEIKRKENVKVKNSNQALSFKKDESRRGEVALTFRNTAPASSY